MTPKPQPTEAEIKYAIVYAMRMSPIYAGEYKTEDGKAYDVHLTPEDLEPFTKRLLLELGVTQ